MFTILKSSRRHGSLIIEAAVSFVLLTTAAVGLMQLARSSTVLTRDADMRTACELATENAIQRLSDVPLSEIESRVEEVAKAVTEITKCEVTISTEPFETGDRQGIHLRVQASANHDQRVTLHDWRFDVE